MKIKILCSAFLLLVLGLFPGLYGHSSSLRVQAAEVSRTSLVRSVTVTAAILPYREVVVDSHYHIVKVISNTTQEVQPTFVLRTDDGPQLHTCLACLLEYQQLQPQLDFTHIGLVYSSAGAVRAFGH